jgi:hypothetical protein
MALILDESWQFCQCGKRFGWAHQFTLEGKLDTFRRKAAENLNFENLNPLAMTKKDKPHTAIIFDELIFSDTKYLCTKFFKRAWGSVDLLKKIFCAMIQGYLFLKFLSSIPAALSAVALVERSS